MRRALRRGRGADGVEVVVSGMGQLAAAASAAEWVPLVGAVVVCGVAGGTGGLAHGGDVVVASRVVGPRGAAVGLVTGVEVMGTVLAPVASVEAPVVDARVLRALREVGAAAVETEAAAWAAACAAARVPCAVVRGVLDTPEEPLGMVAELVHQGATGPGLADLARVAVRPGTWPALVRVGRLAGEAERRAAEVAVRVAAMELVPV